MEKEMIAILTALFIYTIPSNAVFVIVLFLLYRSKAIIIGCIMAGLLYAPLIGGMLSDPQTNSTLFHGNALNTFCETLNAFIGFRWLLVPFIIWGLLRARKTHCGTILVCMTMLTVPFVLFFIQGGTTYGRMFLPTLPFFCLLGAIGLEGIK